MKVLVIFVLILLLSLSISLSMDLLLGMSISHALSHFLNPFKVMEAGEYLMISMLILLIVGQQIFLIIKHRADKQK